MYDGWTVPNDYDPLLSKLIAWGNSREETIARLRRALEEYTVIGIKTNTALFRRILTEPEFLKAEIHTKWLDELLQRPPASAASGKRNGAEDAAAIAAAIWQMEAKKSTSGPANSYGTAPSKWKQGLLNEI